jgi:NADPH2:quinone reductase
MKQQDREQIVIEIEGAGATATLAARAAPVPEPGPGEVLIRVAAAGVNRADVKQRLGRYLMPAGAPSVPGLEVAGEIAKLGPGAERWQIGDRVCALLLGGGYSQYAVAPAVQCLPVPAGLDLVEAAALPEAIFTTWISIIEQARLLPGETLLVHGGAGGVGSFAVQLAAGFGARVLATAGCDEKCAAARAFGASETINYATGDLIAAVNAFTGGRGVDVILNQVGANYLERDIELLAAGGRVVMISHDHGQRTSLDIFRVMFKGVTISGVRLRPRSIAEKGRIAAELERRVWPLIAAGRIRPAVASRLPLAEAAAAHRMLEDGRVIGKLVLICD